MATSGKTCNEVICLLSDDEPPSPRAESIHTEDVPHDAIEEKTRKGKGVLRGRIERSVSIERMDGEDDYQTLLKQNEKKGDSTMRADEPISSWDDHSWNATRRKCSRMGHRQQFKPIEELEGVILIDDTPQKPTRQAPQLDTSPIVQNVTFSATTAAILARLQEASSSSDDELGDLNSILGQKNRNPGTKKRKGSKQDKASGAKRKKNDEENTGAYKPPNSPGKKKSKKLTDEECEQRAEGRARKAAEKEAEMMAKKLEKESKALEKQKEQELDTVNKLKKSKKDSTREMIVDISATFAGSPAGHQLFRFLEAQECEHTVDWNPPMPNAVKWRRKVAANWDENLGYFVPIPQEIREEPHILVVVSAEEFVDMAVGERSLDEHVAKTMSLLKKVNGIKPIYVIEGLKGLLRKSRNAKNRTFQGAVRQAISALNEEGSSRSSRATGNRSRKGPRIVDEDEVEDALLSLQITHGCLIHHTVSTQETSELISVFTSDISTIPYKATRMNHNTSFCADVGQVRTGNDVEDTYFKMLQEITRVTAGVANGIMGEYKSVRELMNACKNEGDAVVADLEIMASKNGISSGRKIGQATSKRIYKFFTGSDPESIDI